MKYAYLIMTFLLFAISSTSTYGEVYSFNDSTTLCRSSIERAQISSYLQVIGSVDNCRLPKISSPISDWACTELSDRQRVNKNCRKKLIRCSREYECRFLTKEITKDYIRTKIEEGETGAFFDPKVHKKVKTAAEIEEERSAEFAKQKAEKMRINAPLFDDIITMHTKFRYYLGAEEVVGMELNDYLRVFKNPDFESFLATCGLEQIRKKTQYIRQSIGAGANYKARIVSSKISDFCKCEGYSKHDIFLQTRFFEKYPRWRNSIVNIAPQNPGRKVSSQKKSLRSPFEEYQIYTELKRVGCDEAFK